MDGEVSTEQASQIKSHLESCAGCQKDLSNLKGCMLLLRKAPQISPSENFYERLRKKIEGHQIPSKRRFSPQLFYLASLAASLLILVSIWLIFNAGGSFSDGDGENPGGGQKPTVDMVSTAEFLKSLGVSPKEEKEIVKHLHILKAYPLLQKLDVIENMDILKNPTVEDYLPNDL